MGVGRGFPLHPVAKKSKKKTPKPKAVPMTSFGALCYMQLQKEVIWPLFIWNFEYPDLKMAVVLHGAFQI